MGRKKARGGPQEARFREECRKCRYYEAMHQFGVCNYLLTTGHRRPTEVETCDLWKSGRKR
jgi:hypothetical protein